MKSKCCVICAFALLKSGRISPKNCMRHVHGHDAYWNPKIKAHPRHTLLKG